MICRSLYPKSDIDRLYCKRKNGGKGLISVEECVRIEKTSLGFYLKEQEHKLLTEVVWEGVILDIEQMACINLKHIKTQASQKRNKNYAQKSIYSAFMRGTKEVIDVNNSLQ